MIGGDSTPLSSLLCCVREPCHTGLRYFAALKPHALHKRPPSRHLGVCVMPHASHVCVTVESMQSRL